MKQGESRLQSQIRLLEDKSSNLEKSMEEASFEHEKEKQKYEKKIEDMKKKLKTMTEDRDSQLLQKDCVIETLRNETEKARLDSTNIHRENEQKISQLKENLRQKEAEMKELKMQKEELKEKFRQFKNLSFFDE